MVKIQENHFLHLKLVGFSQLAVYITPPSGRAGAEIESGGHGGQDSAMEEDQIERRYWRFYEKLGETAFVNIASSLLSVTECKYKHKSAVMPADQKFTTT